MNVNITLEEVKSRWNDVLDHLLAENRIAWLAYFDARITSVTEDSIHLSFVDVEKLGNPHNYRPARSDNVKAALKASLAEVFQREFEIVEN